MSDYQQRIAGSFQERKRLNQLRKRKENLRFWSEFRIIPRWLIALVIVLFFAAQVITFVVNTKVLAPNGEMFPPELKGDPALASLALAGIVTGVSFVLATLLFLMNSALWTILVIILLPAWGFIGFVIYLLMREPLPYPCPECGTAVGARFNFCPNCKCNLHPSCPQCKGEVGELDKFCPHCGNDLKAATGLAPAVQSST